MTPPPPPPRQELHQAQIQEDENLLGTRAAKCSCSKIAMTLLALTVLGSALTIVMLVIRGPSSEAAKATCTCGHPSAANSSDNDYACTDGSSGYCASNNICGPTASFPKSELIRACAAPVLVSIGTNCDPHEPDADGNDVCRRISYQKCVYPSKRVTCAANAGNRGNRLRNDQYADKDDTFSISVDINGQVCATKSGASTTDDSTGAWLLNLVIRCAEDSGSDNVLHF